MIKSITFALYALTATDAYQLDSGLSGADCVASVETLSRAVLIEIVPDWEWINPEAVTLTCELEKPARASRH